MPELPEVEVICRGLRPHVVGRRVKEVWCGPKELRLPIPRKELAQLMEGAEIVSLRRRAKYLLFGLDNGHGLLIHLGMTGRLGIFPALAPPAIHDHLRWRLDNDMELRYNDTRRFGFIRVLTSRGEEQLGQLGPEPFWPEFSAPYLKEKAGRRLQPVKNFLMDNKVVVGIGNIYANEILFFAGLRPTTPIGSITMGQWQTVVEISRQVLEKAIASGGTTISDYVNASGEKGYFQLELMVYGRQGERCKQCASAIEKQVIGGRATFFCPRCQP
ncbi:MAG: bifunctional DNA-formamidopyrimidine glycosylase/DNA-(apurinic or apyrimidinic site) lyase [Thermodesulfobacteriota bacterium]